MGGSDEGSPDGPSRAGPLAGSRVGSSDPGARGPEDRPGEASDREAVARAREGDHLAFRTLVERYQGRAFRLAARVLRDEDRARDVVQEAFLKVYAGLRRFEGRSSFYTWLYRVTLNLCLDLRRRQQRGREVEWSDERMQGLRTDDGGGAAWTGAADAEAPDAQLERAELRRLMADAIDALPEAARATLVLREVEGLSYAEIADALGIPKGTVMSRLHYARRRVQESLREAGMMAEGARGPAAGIAPEPDPEGEGGS